MRTVSDGRWRSKTYSTTADVVTDIRKGGKETEMSDVESTSTFWLDPRLFFICDDHLISLFAIKDIKRSVLWTSCFIASRLIVSEQLGAQCERDEMSSNGLLFSPGVTYLANVQTVATHTDTHAAIHVLSMCISVYVEPIGCQMLSDQTPVGGRV